MVGHEKKSEGVRRERFSPDLLPVGCTASAYSSTIGSAAFHVLSSMEKRQADGFADKFVFSGLSIEAWKCQT